MRNVTIELDGEEFEIPVDAELSTMAAPIVSHGTEFDTIEAMKLPTSELLKLAVACIEDTADSVELSDYGGDT